MQLFVILSCAVIYGSLNLFFGIFIDVPIL